MIRIALTETPVGGFIVAERDGSIVGAAFADAWESIEHDLRARFGGESRVDDPAVAAPFAAYFSDGASLDDLRIDAGGSAFRRAVWSELRKVPEGATISYAALAARAGVPRAARAAGTACATNPVWVAIPCHRVLRAGGAVGRYGGGADRKRWLLAHEGAHLDH